MSSSDDDNNLTSDLTKLYNMVFNKSTLLLIIWFLALHFVCYQLLKFFFSDNLDTLDYQSKLSRMLDIAVFSFLLLFLTASYYSVPDKDKETMLETLADSFKNFANDKDSVYKTVVFLLLFYCAIYLFRIPMNMETKPAFISGTEFGAWTLFLIIIFVKFFNDVFGFSMIDIIYAYLNWSTLPDSSGENKSVNIANGDDDEDCEDDSEEPPSYLSNVLSYVTPASVFGGKSKNTVNRAPVSKPSTVSSIFNNLMSTLSSDSNLRTTTSTGAPQTTLSSNISANTSTTNNLRNNSITTSTGAPQTTLSSNISANTSTTNSLRNDSITTSTGAPQTTLSSNISANTSTTNSLRNDSSTTTTNVSGFRNIRESFGTTSAPSHEINSNIIDKTIIPTDKPEVFNVAGNFTYDEAAVVCAAYGSSLANYDQIEDTYNKGGEWCNYGWSDGQHAYFPTQKSTWNKMQQNSNPESRHKCGRQGINGGYMPDKTKQMGINCYGLKPPPSNKDYELREHQQSVINAKTQEDIELESKIQYWKQQIDTGAISVNHYNQKVWSNFDTTAPPGANQQPTMTYTSNEEPTFYSGQNNDAQIGTVQYNTVPTTFQSIPTVMSNKTLTSKGSTTQPKIVLTTLGPPKMNNPNFNNTNDNDKNKK